jgi:solute carrier family 14 (urea transporter)
VWLINNEYSGAMILAGVAVCSPISSLFALLGSTVGLVCAVALGVDAQEIFAGLWGYNAVLGCVAMGGVFYILSVKVAVLAVMCSVSSIRLLFSAFLFFFLL